MIDTLELTFVEPYEAPGALYPNYHDVEPVAETDTGYEWGQVMEGGTGCSTHLLFHPKEQGLMFMGTDMGGMYRWNDENYTWTPLKDNFTIQESFDFSRGVDTIALDPNNPDVLYAAVDPNNSNVVMCATMDGRILFSFVDKGIAITDEPYEKGKFPTAKMLYEDFGLTHGTSLNIIVNPDNPDDMISNIGGWTEGNYVRTLDGGKNWFYLTDESGNKILGSLDESSCYYPEKNIIYTKAHTSYDNGKTWTKNIRDYYVSYANKEVIYSATERELYRSDDGGKNWITLAANMSTIYSVTPDRFDEKACWVGTYDGNIIKFEDTTKTVIGKENGLSDWGGITYSITTISQNPNDKNHLLAGGKVTHQGLKSPGFYVTYDGGNTWEIVPGMPGAKMFHSFVFSPVSDEIFVATMGGGTFIYEFENYKKYKEGALDLNFFEPQFVTEERYTDGKIRVKINGQLVEFDVEPFTVNGRTMVPMRKIFEVLGAEVTWEDSTQTVGAALGDTKISLAIGSDKACVNGIEKILDAPAMLKDSRTLVPLRFVSESLGCNVEWDGENTLVKITM